MAVQTITITQQAGTDQFCFIGRNLADDGKLSTRMIKMFNRFIIPTSLFGITPTSATLYRYLLPWNPTPTYPGACTFSTKSTTGAWNGSSTFGDLNALSLSTLIASTTLNAATQNNQWHSFNVLGDLTAGVKHACVNSLSSITLAHQYTTDTPDARFEGYGLGDITVTAAYTCNYLTFDFPGNTLDGTHLSYLEIVADIPVIPPGNPIPKSGIAVSGIMF